MKKPFFAGSARVCWILVYMLMWPSAASPNDAMPERERVLTSLTSLYGQPVGKYQHHFVVTSDYFLIPTFSEDGLLVAISIEPKPDAYGPDHRRRVQLPKADFDQILANINSIKPLGEFRQDGGAGFSGGGREWSRQQFENGYIEREDLLAYDPLLPISTATIYYLHPVTGFARIPLDSVPRTESDRNVSVLICFAGKPYIANGEEVVKLWSHLAERQTALLAGPTGDSCPLP